MFGCFPVLIGRKKIDKADKKILNGGLKTLHVKIELPIKSSEADELKHTFDDSMSCDIQKNSRCTVRVMSLESRLKAEAEEAYEGEDEREGLPSMKREFSHLGIQGHDAVTRERGYDPRDKEIKFPMLYEIQVNNKFKDKNDKDSEKYEKYVDIIQSRHVSDPGIDKAVFSASPRLKRSCSNPERTDVLRKIVPLLSSRSQSLEDLWKLSANQMVNLESPRSVMTYYGADRVILKRHSSYQVLPSGSRRLWWKLFLWSHRNIHRPSTRNPPQVLPASADLNRQCGHSSDTIELKQGAALGNVESPGSFAGESFDKICKLENIDDQSCGKFHNGDSGILPQNQWVAFSTGSSFARVDEWVKDLETQQPLPVDDDDDNVRSIVFPPSPDAGRSMQRSTAPSVRHPDACLSKETLHANSIVQSLNPTSTAARIVGIGLKAIPSVLHFSSLRSVNLSSNFIVHITPGFLPKGLHTLNLSRNKISTIEGLRVLARLRVLDLSFNRISRIEQGLSNCTLIKELYLEGNKISDVEGLHRLLKLTVLDLSFNKITTTKALGQLVANYSSLQALNLIGNPIQSNIGDDQLRKAVSGFLPKLVYLNKQSIKPHRAKELLTDSVAKAAFGSNSRSYYKRTVSYSGHKSSASAALKNTNGSKSRNHR